jgi:hypothetical protein
VITGNTGDWINVEFGDAETKFGFGGGISDMFIFVDFGVVCSASWIAINSVVVDDG